MFEKQWKANHPGFAFIDVKSLLSRLEELIQNTACFCVLNLSLDTLLNALACMCV